MSHKRDLDKNGSVPPSPSVVIAIFAVRPIIFAVRCMFVPTTNKQSPQKETGSESTDQCDLPKATEREIAINRVPHRIEPGVHSFLLITITLYLHMPR